MFCIAVCVVKIYHIKLGTFCVKKTRKAGNLLMLCIFVLKK